MSDELASLSWPAERLPEALELLARHRGYAVTAAPAPQARVGEVDLPGWVEAVASGLGLETELVEAPYPEVEAMVRGAAPALLRLPGSPGEGSGRRFLALLGGGRRSITLLGLSLTVVRVDTERLRAALCATAEGAVAADVEKVLRAAGVGGRRRHRARTALLNQLLAGERVGGCFLVRPAAGAGLGTQARAARLPRLLGTLLAAHTAEYGLWVASWWLLGRLSLEGQLDRGWLTAWLLLLLAAVPLRLLVTRAAGRFAVRAGALVKRRLLSGALQLEPDEVCRHGVGQLLGQVLESEAVESLALTGGFLGLTASIELVVAGAILGFGAGSLRHVALLGVLAGVTAWLAYRFVRCRRRWTLLRLAMTNDLVELMVGHRTWVGQEARERRHEGADEALARYLAASQEVDRAAAGLQVFVPRCWFAAGLLMLAPEFLAGGSVPTLAVGVGGVVLAYRAFRNLVDGGERLAAALVAWEQVRSIWNAAGRAATAGPPPHALAAPASQAGPAPVLEALDVAFRHHDRGPAVLQGVSLQIRVADRLLLQGRSGGGKSTLAALLAGARLPQTGLLLLLGLARATLGDDAWRRRMVLAPQFHDNHILMGTLAFNLLLGRTWPPRPEDVAEAEVVCRALDLGPLLDRMPMGIFQVVGETGWQLSHGEKGRVYVARALLQGADLLILDESFAALDPPTLRHTLRYVLERAPALVVIAHP